MKKLISMTLFGIALAVGSANAQVYVRIGPPAPRREAVSVRPGPRHVWVNGYWRWHHGRYVWVPGYWIVPPRPHAVWVDGRWARQPGGWFWVEGHWRG